MSRPSWIGHKLGGRYEITEQLGAGGMATVFKAYDPNLRRVVAVKMIHPHLSQDPEFARRFEAEAAAVAQLRHPNIIQVHDFASDEGVYYIVFEFLAGETLEAHIGRLDAEERTMPHAEIVKVGTDVANGLHYAHERGLVHRDVKPANVMINFNGDGILMDFGIVKIAGGTQHTATGAVLGTAYYMSPEQIRGETADRRTDIYALGITLYQMATGRVPFLADSSMTVMMMHVKDPVPDVRELRPDVPPGLVAIINKALQKDRAQRYQSAAAMARDLAEADLTAAGAGGRTVAVPASQSPERTMPVAGGATAPAYEPTPPATVRDWPPVAPPAGAAPPAGGGIGDRLAAFPGGRAGVAVVAVLLVALIALFATPLGDAIFGSSEEPGVGGDGDEATAAVAVVATATDAPTATTTPPSRATSTMSNEEVARAVQAATSTATPTRTPTPAPPTPTPSPTATEIAGPAVRITEINLSGGTYLVDYTTYGYTEVLPGMHVHFFFNTVPPEQAGVPGNGPWYLWGGPRPFNGYSLGDKPASASEMCALVANTDHSIIMGSGNCVALPPS
jgi:serine/threonine-protein kinase